MTKLIRPYVEIFNTFTIVFVIVGFFSILYALLMVSIESNFERILQNIKIYFFADRPRSYSQIEAIEYGSLFMAVFLYSV